MLGCCQSLGRVTAMDKPHPMTIQSCHALKDTTIEPLDNKEREDLERKATEDVGCREDLPDDEMEKNDSVKDSVSGSEMMEAPQSLSLDGDDVSYSEDNSLDNNTFNIINTEDSQSQEVSDMTNDESPMIVNENGDELTRENVNYKRETDEDSDEELSCLEEEDELDDTDESGDSDKQSTGSDAGEESDDEREFDNESLEDDGKNSDSAICVTDSVPPLELQEPPKDPIPSAKQKTGDAKPASPPKMRRRLRSLGKKENREFTIEIYESRRKPQDIPSLTQATETHNTDMSPGSGARSPGTTLGTNNKDRDISGLAGAGLISPGSTLTTPDSTDNTLTVSLDINNTIREETDESDRISPLKTPSDGGLTPGAKSDSESKDNNNKHTPTTTTTTTTSTPTNTTTTTTTSTTTTTTTTTTTSSAKQPKTLVNNYISAAKTTSPAEAKKETDAGTAEDPEGGGGGGGGKKPYPMAFTIDIGDGSSQNDVNAAKKLDITASISKWAPKHRRNLSLTKVDEHKVVENFFDENGNSRNRRRSTISRLDKVEERASKPPLGRPRSGTVGASAGLTGLTGRRGGGYHSEGYFSSDQDDDGPRRAELKSPRSPRTPELRSPQTPQRLVRSSSQDSAKGASLRKQPGKSEGRACCRAEKKPTLAEATGRNRADKNKVMDKMTAECRKQSSSANSLSSNHTYEMKGQTTLADGAKEEKDDVSEAGTYTIEKDSSSPEVEQARSDIDRVFGVSGTESEVEVGSALTPRGPPPPDEPWTHANAVDQDKFKKPGQREMSPGSLSRSSPNWIQQWAAQVAEHTKSTEHSKATQGSPRGPRIPTTATLSSSQESSESRPRRKLPTPPTLHHTASHKGGGAANDTSDSENPTKGRARVDTARGGLRGNSFESHDSGGDSDLDTSTSYPIHGEDERLTRQLKARLRLVGIEGGAKTPPSASPRRPAGGSDGQKAFRRERSNVSDGGYEFARRVEEGSGQSDSSSDASDQGGHAKDARKNVENNPPLKFNRAFSLRRARLGCDEPSQPVKPPSPIDKKKVARPSSAGSLSSGRKLPLGHTKSQSVGGLRGGGTHTQSSASTPKNATNSADFSRGDGGRFSLRLPRSGSTSAVSKSPSRAATRKDTAGGAGGGRRGAPRSNSTMSAKEVDFQNWKRRKNYDPMKAAAEGRKKVNDKRTEKVLQSGPASMSERSPSPPGSLLRSASFHGTEGMGAVAGRWPRPRPHHLYPSEDEGPYSLEEEQPHKVPHCSPLRRSPTSPQQLCSPHTTSPAHQPSLGSSSRGRRTSYALSDDGEGQVTSPTRKTSLDESGSEGKRSPISSTRGIVSSRSKAKMEALDNLVISTIHSLSVKVRTTSETLLQKLKSQYDEEGDRAALLEEVLSHLSESDQALGGGGSGRSTSRELAGILRNLKKIEHALEVIDRVMVCGDDDDDEDDDDDDDDDGGGIGGPDWGESDY